MATFQMTHYDFWKLEKKKLNRKLLIRITCEKYICVLTFFPPLNSEFPFGIPNEK